MSTYTFVKCGLLLTSYPPYGNLIFPIRIKTRIFQAVAMSVLVYGSTTWTCMKQLEKNQDENYARMLHDVLNKSWMQYPTKHQFYIHLPPISQKLLVKWARHARHCRSKDELLNDPLPWTLIHGHSSIGWLVKTCIDQFSVDTRCCLENLPRVIVEGISCQHVLMLKYLNVDKKAICNLKSCSVFILHLTQSTGAVKYTDCISAEE